METTADAGTPALAPGLSGSALELLEAAIRAVEAKDLAALRSLVADDASFVDPHYPTPRTVGWAAISEQLRWAFGAIEVFRFEIGNRFESGDGRHAAIEVDSHHVLRGGRPLVFRQVFVADVEAGQIRRLEAYEPYGPGGLVRWVLRLTRFGRRLRRLAGRLPAR